MNSKNLKWDRRTFVRISSKSAALLPFVSQLKLEGHKSYTVQQLIDLILKEGNLTVLDNTVDTLKSGSPDQQVTGVISTMFPTIPVIEEAIKRNANFIIAHEPSYYNHADNPDWVGDNAVYQQKRALLDKNKIAIWRFHDYCHALKPDAVSFGVAKKCNWLSYYQTGNVMLQIPTMSLGNLIEHLKKSLMIEKLRYIGDLKQNCGSIALLPGAWGGQRQVSTVENNHPDVLIVGELSEWETAEYIRDSRSFGNNTALIVLGHAMSEEPGMEWFAEWIGPKIPELQITHISSGNPFDFK